MRSGLHALRIGRVLLRYRLHTLAEGTPAGRWLWLLRPFVPRAMPGVSDLPRGARVRLALQELGPIFVKFGQVLSTRRDLVPPDIADELVLLQDQVAPFDGELARAIVERELGRPVGEAFAAFDTVPLASASVAQVHAARLPGIGDAPAREVVVKVLRPGIAARIAADIRLLTRVASFVERTHPNADRIRPREVVDEVATTLAAELDLQREGANASVLRRNWEGSTDLYVPAPVWSHSTERILTLERVHGIPSDDLAAIEAAGLDRRQLAAKAVRVFYTQVFRDNFFHADAHAGNIWIDNDPSRRLNPRFIALDFGIVGQLSSDDQYFLAENFMAIFNKDYRRIAELHVQAGWMPSHIRLDELEAAVRGVCEPYFTRPLAEFSLGEVLLKLFRTAQRYQLTLQPQLILMQKTLLNVEGVSRHLDPTIDIWAVARPVLERILAERYSPKRLAAEFRRRLPELATRAPDMPGLAHAWLTQQVQGRHQLGMHSRELGELVEVMRAMQRRTVAAILGVGLLVVAAVLHGLDAGGPRLWSVPVAAWVAGVAGLAAIIAARPRR